MALSNESVSKSHILWDLLACCRASGDDQRLIYSNLSITSTTSNTAPTSTQSSSSLPLVATPTASFPIPFAPSALIVSQKARRSHAASAPLIDSQLDVTALSNVHSAFANTTTMDIDSIFGKEDAPEENEDRFQPAVGAVSPEEMVGTYFPHCEADFRATLCSKRLFLPARSTKVSKKPNRGLGSYSTQRLASRSPGRGGSQSLLGLPCSSIPLSARLPIRPLSPF